MILTEWIAILEVGAYRLLLLLQEREVLHLLR